MTCSFGEPLKRHDPKIERTLSMVRRGRFKETLNIVEEQAENEIPRPLKDYATPLLEGPTSSILWPVVDVAQFEIKPTTMSMLQ